jgi:hypothetical protein
MKKLFFILFYLSFTLGYAQAATAATGSGTVNGPYQIESPEIPYAGVTISSNATNNTICSGTSVTFTATPSGTGATNYKWKKNGNAISGATNSTYTTSDLVNGDAISVQLSVNSGTIFTTNSVMHLDAGNPSSYPGSGSTWTDLSGNNNNASLPSALVSSYSSTIGLGSFNFQASSSYAIQSSAMNNWNITTTNALSVETWIKRTNYGNYQFWFSTPDLYYRLGVNPSGYLFWDMAHYVDRSTGVLVSEAAWHYIVYTAGRESGNITTRVYLDGALVATQNEGISALSPFTNYLIGDGQTPGWHPLNGNMGLMRVFNSTLTAANVLQNYNAEIDRFTNGLFISNTITMTVNPIPVPVINGLSTVTSGQTNVQYTTAAGMTNYVWSVTGGTATAGGGTADNTITLTWGANGTGHVKVNYTIAGGCTAAAQTDFPVSIFNKTSLSAGSWNDAATWTPTGVPTINENVTVLHALTISNAPIAVCNSLTITLGSVTINADQALTVNGTLTNSSGISSLVMESGASLIQNAADVSATVKRDITAGESIWHLFISPVTQSIQASVSSCFYEAYLDRYNEPTGAWVRLLTGQNVVPAYGYSVKFATGVHSLIFPGTLKASPVAFTNLSYTAGTLGYPGGWNLAGNPYPCGINPVLCTLSGGLNAFAYVWNGSNYNTLSIGNSVFSGTIAPLQGFFVRTSSGINSLTLNNAAKTHGGSFLKDAAVAGDMLKLSVNGNGYSDETYFRFSENATSGFDQEFDAYKLFGLDAAPQLYSMLAEDNAAVNTLPATEINTDIAIGFKAGAESIYTITATGIGSFDARIALLLEDMKTNTTHNLRMNPIFSFAASPGDMEHRFNLHFKNSNGIGETTAGMVDIYSNKHTVYVSHPYNLQGIIQVYDLTGRLLSSTKMTGNSPEKIDMAGYSGSLLVKVISDKGITTGKVFVN